MRLMSPTGKPLVINDHAKLGWVLGSLFFVTNDSQVIDNQAHSAAAAQGLPAPLDNFNNANTDTYGIGLYGQGSLTLFDKLDINGGARFDYEYTSAELANFASSPFVPSSFANISRDDTQVSPQVSVDYHVTREVMPYVSIARGFRAGGFNSAAPAPNELSFGPEQSWSYEAGVKTSWLDNRILFNADYFYIDWKHMQLNAPTGQPSQFFIDDVGRAHSTGCEAEGKMHLTRDLSLFGGFGFSDARFDHYTQTNGVSAHGNRLPNAPETTWNVGAQYSTNIGHGLRLFGRAEWIGFGPMAYDSTNAVEQAPYTLTDFRIGIGADRWRLEGFINNAFNTHYYPVAFPFPGMPSGYVGQEGDPRTLGITLGLTF